ncbi:sigma-54-dependent transcriptional regulator [Pokkaliibacter sp. CJK22405]|uniref:sigma-54-dependent transcriptional regulator n=1 Tax=Pokkaliibacter sp. CJK22405 TaxID=3384615 RepID=UPI003984CFFB
MADSLLILEDESLLGAELKRHFQRQGWEVSLANSLAQAHDLLLGHELDPLVVLSDMSLPDGNALTLLEEIRKAKRPQEWIFLTGYGSIPDSVQALRLGAYDFLEKPCDMSRLNLVVQGAARSSRAQRKVKLMVPGGLGTEAFVGKSAAAQQVRSLLQRLLSVPFSALSLTGETGTGKGLAARILHQGGLYHEGAMVEVNCAALPKDLLESELFGHEAGAFTGAKGRRRGLLEQASGGTLFLDELGEMDLDLQAKLLKAIEDKRIRRLGGEQEIAIDVQIIAATHRNLEEQVREKRFREDLYHRLSVFKLELPALRERLEDLEDLVWPLVQEFNVKARRQVKRISPEVWQRLRSHSWPGNVRELRNVVERCVLLAEGEDFPLEWLQLGKADNSAGAGAQVQGERLILPLDGSISLDEMEKYIIEVALEQHEHNVVATARALGTTRETLRYRMQKFHIKHG